MNLRPESKKFPEENIEDKLLDISDISLCNDFFGFDTHTHTKATKEKVNKWDYLKLKSFCKGNHQKNQKDTYGMGENTCKP